MVQELVIHTWDMRSRFDAHVALSADLLPLLLERIPARFGVPDFVAFPLSQDLSEPVRYRWNVTGVNSRTYDLIVDSGKARLKPAGDAAADVALSCDDRTFALLLYKRLTLEPVMTQGRLVVEGDQKLTMALDECLKQT
jgi:predicted lipid carrier protein YhbT